MAIPTELYTYIASEEDYSDGTMIVEEGGHGNWAYIVLEGKGKLKKKTDRGLVGIATLGKGDLLGETNLLRNTTDKRLVSVFAEGPVVLGLLDSEKIMERAVGLATANALANSMKEGILEGDTLEHLRILPEDKVGMVGLFAPVLPRLKKKTPSVLIFEQDTDRDGDLLPEEEAYRLLPRCDVAMITSTSIVNRTIDRLLDAVHACREVALLGASTPLLREPFAHTPVTVLSGVVFTRPRDVLRVVGEGGGMRLLREKIKKVNLTL